MLCVRAEDALAAAAAVAVASDKMRSVTLGGSIQRAMLRMGGGGRRSAGSTRAPQRPAHLAPGSGGASASASCSGDDSSNGSGKREGNRRGGMRRYRSQLEQEVRKLQRQLQDEIDLHLALTDAITPNASMILKSFKKLPNKVQELIISIASLEITVSKLEKDLYDLRYQLCHVRNERLLAENNPGCVLSASSYDQPTSTCKYTWEEHISILRDLKFGESESMQEDLFPELEKTNRMLKKRVKIERWYL